ncbi:MAG: hypothetical protein SFX73_29165 [Kofleriaceae bacterium]|nr:hypothetical protein [Kofleriaceae bacterium]
MPALLRWLLSIAAAVALMGTSMTSFAGSGFVGDSECCCPDPDKCNCHDHDQEPVPSPTMKRCGGEAKLVAPTAVVAVLVEPFVLTTTTTTTAVVHPSSPKPPDRTTRPEKPPF